MMEEYNDYELVALAQEKNEDAIELLYNKYRPIIAKKSKYAISYASHHGIDINDIMQEGYIGFDEAIQNFSQDDGATFYTFALLCVDRQIFSYLKKTIQKNKLLNDAVAIDEGIEQLIKDDIDVENVFLNSDYQANIIEILKKKLTDFELKVFNLKIEGYTFEEIAHVLNRNLKSIYNTFQRIKFKLKKIVNNDNYD